MFEKTKLIMAIAFTLCFLSYSFLIGKFYDKFHISREVMVAVCIILTIAVAVSFIIDVFFAKRATDQAPKSKE